MVHVKRRRNRRETRDEDDARKEREAIDSPIQQKRIQLLLELFTDFSFLTLFTCASFFKQTFFFFSNVCLNL